MLPKGGGQGIGFGAVRATAEEQVRSHSALAVRVVADSLR